MRNYYRIFVALAILLSGLALIPYVSLSSEPFGWQQYAAVYEPEPVQVNIRDFTFSPGVVLVTTGTTVRWVNQDSVAHTVTSNDGLFDSGPLGTGDAFEYRFDTAGVRFDTAGVYAYFCAIHPSVTGQVIVVDQILDVFLPIVLR